MRGEFYNPTGGLAGALLCPSSQTRKRVFDFRVNFALATGIRRGNISSWIGYIYLEELFQKGSLFCITLKQEEIAI